MVDYKIIVKDLSGNSIGEFERFSNLRYQKVLNAEGDCSFDIDIFDEKANNVFILPGLREVYIYRNGQIAWGGVMWHYSGSVPTRDNKMTIQCVGFLRWLKKACIYSEQVYTDVDAADFCWTLIDNYQTLANANRGITRGAHPTTFNLNDKVQFKTVFEQINKMSKQGFDYEITQTKVFNVYYPFQGTDKSASVIYDLNKNISQLDFQCDFDNIANEVCQQGSGYGAAANYEIVDNTSLQASYGLLQKVNPSKNVDDTTSLTTLGQQDLDINGLPRQQFNITAIPSQEPDYSDLDIGDWILVRGSYGNFVNLNNSCRVSALEVTYDKGIEYIKPTFQY